MVYHLWLNVYGLFFILYSLLFMFYGLWFIVYGLRFIIYDLSFMAFLLSDPIQAIRSEPESNQCRNPNDPVLRAFTETSVTFKP